MITIRYLFLLSIIAPLALFSQKEQDTVETVYRTVDVYNTYLPSLTTHRQIFSSPKTIAPDEESIRFEYNFIPPSIYPTTFLWDSLPFDTIENSNMQKKLGGHVRLGFGTALNPLWQGGVYAKMKKTTIGAGIWGYAELAPINTDRFKDEDINELDQTLVLFANQEFKNTTWENSFQYRVHQLTYFGRPSKNHINLDPLKLPTPQGALSFFTFNSTFAKPSNVNSESSFYPWQANIGIYTLNNNNNIQEVHTSLSGNVSLLWETGELSIKAQSHFFTYSTLDQEEKGFLQNDFSINPVYYMKVSRDLNASIGFQMEYYQHDSGKFLLMPEQIGLDYRPQKGAVRLFTKLSQRVQLNTQRQLYTQIPWLFHLSRALPTKILKFDLGTELVLKNHQVMATLTLRDAVNEIYSYVDLTQTQQPFRYLSLSHYNLFTTIVNLSWNGKISDKTAFSIQYTYNNLPGTAWMSSEQMLKTSFSLQPIEKLETKLALSYASSRETLIITPTSVIPTTLDPLWELNLDATYIHSKRLRFFGKLANILNQHYDVVYGYGVRGINLTVGLQFIF